MYVVLANLTNGGLSGGSRKYLEVLAPLLARQSSITKLDLFVPPNALAALQQNSSLVWETWDSRDVVTGFRKLGTEVQRRNPDVVFIPTARWMDCGSIPVIAMVRNMEPLAFRFGENPFMETIRTIQRAWVARRVCRKATRVIAVSGFVRQHLERCWQVGPEKLATIYHGIDMPPDLASFAPPASLSNLSVPFLLTAGSIRPYRRLEDLVQSLSILERRGRRMPLVIAGGVDPGMDYYFRGIKKLARRLGVEKQIIWAGKLDTDALSWCYSHCHSFVMTSRVEACPNTVLEAMAHGCLNVSTDAAPMPEMFGDCAEFYVDQRPEHLAEQLFAVLSLSSEEQVARRKKSRQRALQFTWQRTAELTVQELARAAEHRVVCNRKAA